MTDTFIHLGDAARGAVDKLRSGSGIERIKVSCATAVGRQQWLELRMRDITASDVGAVCGVSPYRNNSAAKVWALKKGLIPPDEETSRMRAGRWFEPAAYQGAHGN